MAVQCCIVNFFQVVFASQPVVASRPAIFCQDTELSQVFTGEMNNKDIFRVHTLFIINNFSLPTLRIGNLSDLRWKIENRSAD